MMDPTTLLLYKIVLVAAIFALLCGGIAMVMRAVSRVGSRDGAAGIAEMVKWWGRNGKTYLVVLAWIASQIEPYIASGTPVDWSQIFQAVGLATLRMAMAKQQKATETTAIAAKVTAARIGAVIPPKEEA